MKYWGRPRKYKTPEEMQKIIDDYFKECEETKEVPTISGLAFALDMSRKSLLDYENSNDRRCLKNVDDDMKASFSHTIKRAKAFIHSRYEQALFNKNSVTGAIFTLKNNCGWVDRVEQVVENKEIVIDIEE